METLNKTLNKIINQMIIFDFGEDISSEEYENEFIFNKNKLKRIFHKNEIELNNLFNELLIIYNSKGIIEQFKDEGHKIVIIFDTFVFRLNNSFSSLPFIQKLYTFNNEKHNLEYIYEIRIFEHNFLYISKKYISLNVQDKKLIQDNIDSFKTNICNALNIMKTKFNFYHLDVSMDNIVYENINENEEIKKNFILVDYDMITPVNSKNYHVFRDSVKFLSRCTL